MTVRYPRRPFRLPVPRSLLRPAALAAILAASAALGLIFGYGIAPPVRAQDPAVPPLSPSATQVNLPVLGFAGGEAMVCDTWVEIQLVGDEPSKAVIITWGEPGPCPPQTAGPLKVECTGLLLPGATWNLLGAQIPTGSRSGILFSFTAKMLSDIGLDDDLGFDDVVADLMCEELFFGVVGDGDDYRRFKKAYDEGSDFRGIPQRLAAGGPLAVQVRRDCPSGDASRTLNLAYSGVPGSALGASDPVFGGFGYYLPEAVASHGGRSSHVYALNAGQDCASVEIWWQARPDAGEACDTEAIRCALVSLAPGEAIHADVAAACRAENQAGSLWLRSTMPLAVAVDTLGAEAAASYTGQASGAATLIAPMVLNDHAGWRTRLHVQNLDPTGEARVKAYFQDRMGDVITAAEQTICARGSATIDLAAAGLPGTWIGSVRIDSQTLALPGGGERTPRIAAVAEMAHQVGDGLREQVYFELAPGVPDPHDATAGRGAGMLALPSLVKPIGAGADASELAIANVVTKPGFTDIALYLFDQNGLLDVSCRKLEARQVAYIDLRRLGGVNPGFRGSAVVSATSWRHEVFGPSGNRVANPVGLAAVVLHRTLSYGAMGDPVETFGDLEGTGYTGIPILPNADRPFNPALLGGACPGDQPLPTRTPTAVETRRPFPTPTPARFTPPPGTPLPTVPPPPMEPPIPLSPSATQHYLPILGEGGVIDCGVAIAVQNLGSIPSKASLVTWGDPGFCPPQAAGPLKVECSGLIAPGQIWRFSNSQIPTGSRSAAVYSFSAKRLSEIGMAGIIGFDDVIADMMCEELFFGVVGDGDDYRRFKQAYDSGGVFAGLPQYLAAGSPLGVTVERECPSSGRFDATYGGVPGSALGVSDPVLEGFTYDLAHAAAGRDGASSRVYVQNAGQDCASVEVWFTPQDGPLGAGCTAVAQRCANLTIAPGESHTVDVAQACGLSGAVGSLRLRSTSPLASVVETTAALAGATYAGGTARAQALVAPLIYHDVMGWGARIHVHNPNPEAQAQVKVFFLDRSGDVITTLVAPICPQGSRTFDLATVADLPGNWIGSARVESQVIDQAGGMTRGPDIVGIAELIRPPGADHVPGLIHYTLAPAAGADAAGASRSGAGLVGLPVITKGRDGAQTTEIAIANTVALPGFTDFAMFIFDQNGLLDFVCQKLNDRQVEYIDLATWGFVNPGFTGSAVVSATFWEHDVFDATGDFVTNLVGLGAVTLERRARIIADGTRVGDGAGTEGIALAGADNQGFSPVAGLAGIGCPSGPVRFTPTPPPFETPTPVPTGDATPTDTGPPPPETPTPTALPPTAPRPSATAPLPSPTTRSTDLPTPVPTATITAPRPTSTAVLATPTVPLTAATATPSVQVCELIRSRVPAQELDRAVANPASVSGYNQLQYPNRPPGPFNLRRTWLTLSDAGRPWNRLYNGLVFKVGCR